MHVISLLYFKCFYSLTEFINILIKIPEHKLNIYYQSHTVYSS